MSKLRVKELEFHKYTFECKDAKELNIIMEGDKIMSYRECYEYSDLKEK